MLSSPLKVAVFYSHPIQYFSPIWRQLAKDRSLDLTVFYLSDSSIRGDVDPGFGRKVKWDVPLLTGYKSVFLKRNARPNRRWSLFLNSIIPLLRDGGFKCVIIPGYARPFEWQVLWAAKSLGIRVIMRGDFVPNHGGYIKGLIREFVLRWIYRRVDAFGVVGRIAHQHLIDHGVSPNILFRSPYCVDNSLFYKKKNNNVFKLRKKLGLKLRDKVILFTGKLVLGKRPDTLIEALAQMTEMPELKAVFVGDGEYMLFLQKLAEKLIPGRAIFTGFVNQTKLSSYYELAYAFVLPSSSETWGLVINEAMHFGLPVFASKKVGCVPDLVLPGITGEVFDVGDSQTLAKHLRQLFSKPGLRQHYSTNALKIIKEFTPLQAAKGLRAAIAKAVG